MTTELLEQELIIENEGVVELASYKHGRVGGNVVYFLKDYIIPRDLGDVLMAQTTYKVVGKPSTRQPDITFVIKERRPINEDDTEVELPPDLAVEIISKNDTIPEMDERIIQYQQSGVRLIWVVHTTGQTVEVFRLAEGLASRRFTVNDEISGEDVIPGFKIRVSAFFAR